jgi:DNA repair protein SbcD/Mre11
MDIVAIAGNHDSPARLGAASAVLRELAVHVVGGLPRQLDGSLDLDRILIPIAGGRGLVAAVPFLRPVDAPPDVADPLETIYGEVIAAARARRVPGQALLVTGHLYVAGADAAYLSERRVSIGGVESAPLRLFPDDIDYVALGHIHRAQRIGRDSIRYAGAPIALSLDEASYRHQVVAIDVAQGRVSQIRSLEIPQVVEIIRVPPRGAAALETVLAMVRELPPRVGGLDAARPYLEVAVALDKPEPKLRGMIDAALDGKHARLIRIGVELTGDGAALADRVTTKLAELDPREVFVRLWSRDHAELPGADVLAGFDRLVAEVQGDVFDPELGFS